MSPRAGKTRRTVHQPHLEDHRPPKPTSDPKGAVFDTIDDHGTRRNRVTPDALTQTEGGTVQFTNEIESPAIVLFKPGPIDMTGHGLVAIGNDWYMLVLDPADPDGTAATSAPITLTKRTPTGVKKRHYTVVLPGNGDGPIGAGGFGPESAQDPQIIIAP
jgi:hypothetical protein